MRLNNRWSIQCYVVKAISKLFFDIVQIDERISRKREKTCQNISRKREKSIKLSPKNVKKLDVL